MSEDDDRVYRCTCGAWRFRGQPCATCKMLEAQAAGAELDSAPGGPS